MQGGGAEQLGWNLQFSAVLWVDGVAHLDHAVANAVDHPLEVAGPAEAFHPGTRYLQPAEAGVVEQGYRMVDTQGQQYLGLYVGILDIHFAVDEHRGQLRALIRSGLGGGQHMQTDRLAAGLAQMHRRYHEEAGTQRPQRNDPAGDRRGAAVHLADQTQLAAALNLEMLGQWTQIQLAEAAHGRALQRQLETFALDQAGAVHAGFEGGVGQGAEQRQQADDQQANHGVVSCCCRC